MNTNNKIKKIKKNCKLVCKLTIRHVYLQYKVLLFYYCNSSYTTYKLQMFCNPDHSFINKSNY